MNKIDIANELNENCENRRCRSLYDRLRAWTDADFDDEYKTTITYCCEAYMYSDLKLGKTTYEPRLCDNCANILSKYKNQYMVQEQSTDQILEKILERLDKLERYIIKQ